VKFCEKCNPRGKYFTPFQTIRRAAKNLCPDEEAFKKMRTKWIF